MELSWSEKDYMEAIYILKMRLGPVRSVDVANYLEHSKPSITRAVAILSEKGYLKKNDNDLVFTELGWQVAERIVERHCILTHALKEMGIDEATAIKDAQRMERVISDNTVSLTAKAINCQKQISVHCPLYYQMVIGRKSECNGIDSRSEAKLADRIMSEA